MGDYELIEEIARGGMGIVYRAWQERQAREVSVKMILAGELAMPESVQRFRNQAGAAARRGQPAARANGAHPRHHRWKEGAAVRIITKRGYDFGGSLSD